MEHPKRHVDFICPFQENNTMCSEVMSPMRQEPSNREKKLFMLMGLDSAPTKNACPHCSVFLQKWKQNVGLWGHIKYLFMWLFNKKIRSPQPQNTL